MCLLKLCFVRNLSPIVLTASQSVDAHYVVLILVKKARFQIFTIQHTLQSCQRAYDST